MRVLAIDPGTTRSAWVVYDGQRPTAHGLEDNATVLHRLHADTFSESYDAVVLEQVASYGMPVGAEVFETVFWTGRFYEATRAGVVARMPRREVKLHLCGQARAKDAHIRQAVIDRFGGSAAKGTKRSPGPLYGLRADLWQALALALTWHDQHARNTEAQVDALAREMRGGE